MKINMDTFEDKYKISMFKSAPIYRVKVQVEFTDAEIVGIKKANLMDKTFFSQPLLNTSSDLDRRVFDDGFIHTDVETLVKNKGFNPYFGTPLDAKEAMEAIADQFRLLKQNLTAIDAPSSASLEL